MGQLVIGRDEFRDRVYACWLGKNIGGTLGGPWETLRHTHCLEFYDPIPDKSAANDDLDLQLVWLSMLEQQGTDPSVRQFAEYWATYASSYPWNEYGFWMRNYARGLRPPVAGCFENYFVDEMGSPIRSEIWACLCPGAPQRAAVMAWMDSALDHAGGEGMCGEMFWAAVESAAFVLSDPVELIRIGLNIIPPACQISRVIREALWCHGSGLSWAEARERIDTVYGHSQPCNAVPNHGFIILGWLYGEDFGDRLCKAVNCGYDTDCTGATLGSVLGIVGGTSAIPAEWSDPVGAGIVLHKFTGDCGAPKTLDELTDRTVAAAERSVRDLSPVVAFGGDTYCPREMYGLLYRNEEAFSRLQEDIRSAIVTDQDLTIILYYNGDPVLYPGIARVLAVECRKDGFPVEAEVDLTLPDGWEILDRYSEGTEAAFDVRAAHVADTNTVEVKTFLGGRTCSARFTVLGPGAAQGYPSATQVDYCPQCGGRQGSCLCAREGDREEP